ncbi:uncharacterized protein [Amphiura filiformis]|uniref:uncharacterized protein isoform X2 n=1 Tax=Amphiura filiformis TaxID=82378 RepID=UPI003B21AF00
MKKICNMRAIQICIFCVSWYPVMCDPDMRVYRDDLKCGAGHLAPNGTDAICPGQCCSADGLCGNTDNHCNNADYREYTPARPTGPPLNITAQYLPIGNLVLVKWDPPAINERNAVITHYKITHYKNNDKVNSIKKTTSLNYFALKYPEAGTEYGFKISAATVAGTGPRSQKVIIVTPDELSIDEQIYHKDGDWCGSYTYAPNGQKAICPGECCSDDSCTDCDSSYITYDYRDLDLLSLPSAHGLLQPTTPGSNDQPTIRLSPPANINAQYLSAIHLIYVSWDAPESTKNDSNIKYNVKYTEEYWTDTTVNVEVDSNYFILKDVWPSTHYWFWVSSKSWGFTTIRAVLRTPNGMTPGLIYRDDGMCGAGYPARNGKGAICPGECCEHHRCDERCGIYATQDYRDLDLVALDRSLQPPTTANPQTTQTTSFDETIATTIAEDVDDTNCLIKPRRYDIADQGMDCYFRGWADVQGQGASNDYCRIVGLSNGGQLHLSCALAGTKGDSEYNYNSPDAGYEWIDIGYTDTWYMKDEDGDGKDDYCRCVGRRPDTYVSCMKAGDTGFLQMRDFTPDGAPYKCHQPQFIVNPFLGPP